MILFQLDTGHTVRLNEGKFTIDGPSAAKIHKHVQQAVKRTSCHPEDGEPDFNTAKALIAEHGGKILEFEPTSVPGRVY